MSDLIDFVLNADEYIAAWHAAHGAWVFLIMGAILFCETGLIVMPIIPGDTLVFTAGAMASVRGAAIDPVLLIAILCCASIGGDAVNYAVGRWLGPRIFSRDSRLLSRGHVDRARRFYEAYGGRAIVAARFVPVLRTLAPFAAGMGSMPFVRFASFNAAGGVVWVTAFVLLGFWFGSIPTVARNLYLVVVAIAVISLTPLVASRLRSRRSRAIGAAG